LIFHALLRHLEMIAFVPRTTTPMMRRVSALLPIILTASCDGMTDRPAVRHEVVDSAGIQLVRNTGAGEPAAPEPDLMIGTVDGAEEFQFYRVIALAVNAGGEILVADGSGTIRIFDGEGSYVRTFGGRGDGPGEFQWPSRIFVYGDTIAVSDSRLDRLTEFDSAGVLLRTTMYRQGRSYFPPVGRAGDGWIVQPAELAWTLEIGRARRDTTRVAFVTELSSLPEAGGDGAAPPVGALRPVVEYEAGRMFGIGYELEGRAGMTGNSPLWEPTPAHAVDASGNVYVSKGAPYRIDVYDADGVHWRSILRDHVPVPATRELNARYWDKVNTYLDTTSNRRGEWAITVAAERGRRDLPVNETLPALGRLIASDDGLLWAHRPDLAPDPLLLEWTRERVRQDSHWDVFDHEGRFLLTVRLPAAFRAMTASGRSIYGVLRDDMDVEHIARFTLPDAG
jgi:hypothetical protein